MPCNVKRPARARRGFALDLAVENSLFAPERAGRDLAGWLGAKGAVSWDAAWLFVIGLPALAGGLWLGLKLYGRLDEQMFRKLILVLLLVSGASLLVR